MADRQRLGVPEALYLRPLIHGLDRSDVELHRTLPAQLAIDFRDRPEFLRGAFLSPLDYARHGANYQIVPGLCVSSSDPTGTIRLYINPNRKNISTLAVDIRVTSEIILARIVLLERFPNLSSERHGLTILPMMPDPTAMLAKADAALVVNLSPSKAPDALFSLDLVEEWSDLTGLPYVHGMWVVREDQFTDDEVRTLLRAKEEGTTALTRGTTNPTPELPGEEDLRRYYASFSYDMSHQQVESLTEFFRYAFYHGVLRDIPDLNFYMSQSLPEPSAN
ncbi:MAG: MqnA/MqnD/SBP family protein [Bacteroidota bacterium]